MGIRKVVGAELIWLIGRFIGESLLLTAISVSVALLEVSFLLPSFNSLTGKHWG